MYGATGVVDFIYNIRLHGPRPRESQDPQSEDLKILIKVEIGK